MNRRLKQDAASKGLTDKPKRPWRKPRLRFVHFKTTKAGVVLSSDGVSYNEGSEPWDNRYDPNLS